MKRFRKRICLSIALLLLAVSVHASASIAYIEDITLSMPGTWFYTSTGGFAVDDMPAITADLRVFGAAEYDYRIDDAVVTVTHCALQWTNPTGSIAEGEFAGGATLTVTGILIEKSTGTAYTNIGDTIFEAEMVLSSSERWTLVEDASLPSRFGASVDFTPSDGGLNAGIAVGGEDVLKLDSFNCGISATNVQPYDPSNFGASVPFMIGPDFKLQITAVPEPCTILLMSFGGIALLRNRKK